VNVIEKDTRATSASNLRDDAHHHQTEVLAAAALSGGIGTLLFRAKWGGDASTIPARRERWREIVVSKAAHRNWPADVCPAKVARLSLDFWLCDVCEACSGRLHDPLAGIPSVLGDIPCRSCAGSGKRSLVAQHKMQRWIENMIDAMDASAHHAAGQMMKRLASDMDL
jgi:hypothetical protein